MLAEGNGCKHIGKTILRRLLEIFVESSVSFLDSRALIRAKDSTSRATWGSDIES